MAAEAVLNMVAPIRARPRQGTEPRTIAAVELGSNSFHLLVVRNGPGGGRLVDRMRERVGLESAIGADRRVTGGSRDVALACLERFGERLKGFDRDCVRAVGTHALRQADDPEFLRAAESALGHEIEVLPGDEEARLVNAGVTAGERRHGRDRVVIDIGGGSTECIHDREGEILHAASASVGCVSGTARFFAGGELTRRRFDDAIEWAHEHLAGATANNDYRGAHDEAVGSSGTINAVQRVLRELGIAEHHIDRDSLHALRRKLIGRKHIEALNLDSVRPDRRDVLPGGVAVLFAACEALEIDRLRAVQCGFREGLVRDLLGRVAAEDRREASVQRAMRCCSVDGAQARRVARTVEHLRAAVASAWEIDSADARHLLEYAARLHEVGLALAHSGYHRHGEYFLMHGELVGFSNSDRACLATLVRHHRRKFANAKFPLHPALTREQQQRLCCVLRLGVLLNRARSDRPLADIRLRAEQRRMVLSLPERDRAPMTVDDLEAERRYLEAAGMDLDVRWERG